MTAKGEADMNKIYTNSQATDEAVRLLIRKLHRLYPDAHADLIQRIPDGAREALHFADLRADNLMHADTRDGITREYPTHFLDDGEI